MRDAIGEHGSTTELSPVEAAKRGCLGTLRSLHWRGCGDRRQLQVLQWLRQNACPWEEALGLGIAVQESHAAVVRRMIDAGADLNKAMNDGVTPLHIAAGRGHAAIFQILREAGAV